MHRVGKTADTPQKRQSALEESMSGKEAITKSGRKVKRPATFDSPERTPAAPAADARKSGRKAKPVSADSAGIPATATPGKRTLKPEESASDIKTSRRTLGSATIAAACPSVAVQQQKKPLPDPAVDDSGISKSGRKIKVPAKLIDFESEILSSPRKPATIVQEGEATNDPQKATTTPARLSRVVKKSLMDDVDENQPPGVKSARAGRAKSIVAKETPPKAGARANSDVVESSSRAKSPSAAGAAAPPPKTPKARAKSLTTAKLADAEALKDELSDTPKTGRKPGRPAATALKKLSTDSPALMASDKSVGTLERANTSTPPEKGRTPRALTARVKSVASPNIDETESQIHRPSDAPKSGRKPGRPAGMSLKTMPTESQGLQQAAPANPSATAEKENTVSPPKRGRTPGRVAGKSQLNSRFDSPVPPAPKMLTLQTPSKPVETVEQEKEQATKSAIKTARTPGRPRTVKSLAPPTQTKPDDETSNAAEKPAGGRTPGPRAAKSLMPDSSERAEVTENISKGGATEGDRALSRSGRKIKPKKIFEIEQNEGGNTKQLEDAKVRPPTEGKKRKADEADAETCTGNKLLSPRKKVTTDKVKLSSLETDQGDASAVQSMPLPQLVLKKVNKGEKPPTEPPTVAPQTPNKASTSAPSKSESGSVSRSGRKIKQKKMFGFDDDDSDAASEPSASSNVTKATTSSSSEARSQKEKQKTPITAAEKVEKAQERKMMHPMEKLESPTSAASSPRPKSLAQVSTATGKEEAAEDEAVYQTNNFVTKRGMDDHHHRKRQAFIAKDEPDRALLVEVPAVDILQAPLLSPAKMMKSPSLGVAKSADAQQRQTTTVDEGVTEAAGGKDAGSSRSGRKIKPKKFFDDDGCSVHSVAEHPPVAGEQEPSKATEPKLALVDETAPIETQKKEESKVLEAMDTVEGEPEVAASSSPPDDADIAEGGVAAVPMEDKEQEVKESEADPPSAEGDCAQAVHELHDAGKEDDASDGRVVDPVEPEVTQQGQDGAEGPTKTEVVEQQAETTPMVVATAEEETVTQVQGEGHTPEVVPDGGGVGEQPANETLEKYSTVELVNLSDTNVAEIATNLKEGGAPVSEEARTVDCDADDKIQDGLSGEPCDDALNIHNISADSSIEELRLDENDLLIDGTFGEIEYLEDEEPNIAEHIKEHTARVASRTGSEGAAPEELSDVSAAVPTITVIPETPLPVAGRRATLDETFSPIKPDPVAAAAIVIDITDTPQIGQKQPTPAATAPRTVTASSATVGGSKFSPDKPPEIIEILDSPAVMIFNRQINDANHATKTGDGGGGGSATSTPLASKAGNVVWSAAKPNNHQQQPAEGRKRSLSMSAADTTKTRNVTFYSPANCTVLVDTIDERLMMKSLQEKDGLGEESGKKTSGPRKRSLSEYRPGPEAEVKPSKISRKVPNFKNIHANHFNRMESIAEFMNRKEQRAKNMISAASPATKLLARSDSSDSGASTVKKETSLKPFVFKSGGGGGGGVSGGGSIPAPTASLFGLGKTANQRPIKASNIVRPVLATAASREALAKRKAATDMRIAERLHQFKAKQLTSKDGSAVGTSSRADSATAASGTSASTSRPVEQLRMKRSKLLKGVRTNRRFELQMKHRDTHQ